jgi:hypothetical protein
MCESDNQTSNILKTNSIQTLNSKKMKKMKKSLFTLLSAILMVGCFTSCLENEIPEEVTAIYEQQANLLAAEAMMEEAEAEEKKAQAALVRAQVDLANAEVEAKLIANAMLSAENVIDLAIKQAELEQLVADALLAAEKAKMALLEAQAELDLKLAEIARDILALDDANLTKYFTAYTTNVASLSAIQLKLIEEQKSRLTIQLLFNTEVLGQESALAALTLNLNKTNATIADLELEIAELTASIAVGTSEGDNLARIEALKAEQDALEIKAGELAVAIGEKENEVDEAALDPNIGVDISGLSAEHATAVGNLNLEKAAVAALSAQAKLNLEQIVVKDSLVEAHDAGLEALTTASDEAKIVMTDAAAALVAATRTDFVTDSIFQVENDSLNSLVTARILAGSNLNIAATAYTAKLNTASGQAAVTAAETAFNDAQEEFDDASEIYDAKPNGRTYVDGGRDLIIGNHEDDNGTITDNGGGNFTTTNTSETFVAILTVTGAPGNPNNPDQTATFDTDRSAAVPAGEFGTSGRILGEFEDGSNNGPTDVGNFSDIELDDVIPALNVDRYNAAVSALEFARNILEDAEADLDQYNEELAVLKTMFDDAESLFKNILELEAAQEVVTDEAQEAFAEAILALTAATVADGIAIAESTAADMELSAFPTKQSLLDESAQLAVDNQQITIDIADKTISITLIEEDIARILAQIEIGKTPETIAAEELLDALNAELAVLNSEVVILNSTATSLTKVITAIEALVNLTIDEDAINDAIEANEVLIAMNIANLVGIETSIKTADIASDNTAAVAAVELASKDIIIAALQAQSDFYTLLVAKYKAIVNSLL